MRLKPPRRRVMAKLRDDCSDATGPNQVWAMDWMYDELFDGRRLVAMYGAQTGLRQLRQRIGRLPKAPGILVNLTIPAAGNASRIVLHIAPRPSRSRGADAPRIGQL